MMTNNSLQSSLCGGRIQSTPSLSKTEDANLNAGSLCGWP